MSHSYHVLFISAAQVVYANMDSGIPKSISSRYIPATNSQHTLRTHIVDAVLDIAQAAGNLGDSAGLVIIYGSPWGSATLHQSTLSKTDHDTPVRNFLRGLFSRDQVMGAVHGATYPIESGSYITAAHPVGYKLGDTLIHELPKNKLASTDVVHIVDRVDARLHRDIVAALFPKYLQVRSFMVVSYQGLVLSRMLSAGMGPQDALVVVGARTVTAARHSQKSILSIMKADIGFQQGLRTGQLYLYDAVHKDVSEENKNTFKTACVSLLDMLYPEVLVTPVVTVAFEPHPRAVQYAQSISEVTTIQGTRPQIIMSHDTSLDTWLRDMWSMLSI
jgi:hypothetical protein